MNTQRYFRLGVFMLTTLGVLVAGAIALGARRIFEKSITVDTCFNESIAGLDVGAPVKYRGVTIGHVQSIRFPHDLNKDQVTDPFKYILVEMAFDPHVVADVTEPRLKPVLDQMVAAGLRARVAQSGITGSAYVELNYLDPKRYPIAAVPVPTNGLYVPSAPGALNQVVDALTDIATKLQRADLDKVVGHADALILRVDQAVQDLQVAELRKRTDAVLGNVQSASARVDDLLKNGRFDETAGHLRQTAAEAEELLATQGDTVRSILSDLQATVANVREMTEDVKGNPSRLIFGQPPPRTEYGRSK